jgi:hypothetical protein
MAIVNTKKNLAELILIKLYWISAWILLLQFLQVSSEILSIFFQKIFLQITIYDDIKNAKLTGSIRRLDLFSVHLGK